MPIYQYREGTRLVERVLPVERRDEFPGRIPVPERVAVCPRGEPTAESSVMKGFRDVELSIGTDGVRRETGFTPEQIKRAWSAPES